MPGGLLAAIAPAHAGGGGGGGGGGGTGPNLSSTYLASIGVTVGSFINDFHDVTTAFWDRGAGGTPMFGSVNGIGGSSLTSNGFVDGSGVTHIRTNSSSSIWTCTIPNGLAGNGRGGGAATGFILPSRCIVEWQIAFPLNSGDPTHGYTWDGPYTQTRQTTSAGVTSAGYIEMDVLETAGWSGGGRQATFTYHWGPNNSVGPNTVSPTPLLPYADGNYHNIDLIKLGEAPTGHAYVVWDGAELSSFTMQGNSGLQHCLHLTGGYTSTSQPPFFPYDMLVRKINVWNC